MSQELQSELKKEFQLERLILFSDAVFAIAITLLVIEIKVPEISRENLSEQALIESLWHLFPKFIGFLVSFLIIGLYWTVHHRLFGYVVNYNQGLLWLNLFFLMAVALMPFSSAFYSEYITHLYKSPVLLYVANISFLGFLNYALARYISNPKHHLTEGLSQLVARYYALRALAVPIVFLVMGIVYFFSPKFAIFIPMAIPFAMRIIFRRMKKKVEAEQSRATEN